MEFTDYLNVLRTYIGGNRSDSDYFDMVFCNCFDECVADQISKYNRQEKFNLLSGNRNPGAFCSKFLSKYNGEAFMEFLQQEISQDTVPLIIQDFKKRGVDIDGYDFDTSLNDIFLMIIKENAASYRSSKTSGGYKLRAELMEENQNGICPVEGCGNPLMLAADREHDHLLLNAYFFDENGPKDCSNSIGICGVCFSSGKINNMKLREKKRIFTENKKAYRALTSDENDSQLLSAINKMKTLDMDHSANLSYKSLAISRKISCDNAPLRRKVEMYVSAYFPQILEEFSKGDGENGYSFERLAKVMRTMFEKTNEETSDQGIVFETLVTRICELTDCGREISEILVSFFIQTCEVFYEISE